MHAGRVRELAPGSSLAGRMILLDETTSTMDEAREALGRQAPPLIVAAGLQTAGRGREGRTWHSPPGQDIYMTAALPVRAPPPSVPAFTLAVGVALHRSVESIASPAGLSLKWPNDLWCRGRKLAGVLCESLDAGGTVVLVGAGINVNAESFPPPLDATATSLRLCAGRAFEREQVLARFLVELEEAAGLFEREGFAAFRAECIDRCLLWGRTCRAGDLEGTMETIDEGGALVLRLGDGSRASILSGHVEIED